MLGAIIGDIIGSRFEFYNTKRDDFELFVRGCEPTDDSVMTVAIAEALCEADGDPDRLPAETVKAMQRWGRMYPDAGYGGRFMSWLEEEEPIPYNSLGNGAAMRVSPCAWAARSLEEAKLFSRLVTGVTHDHPEGLKAAEAVTTAIWMAREGKDMAEIRHVIERDYYRIDFTLDEIRPYYAFDVTCMGSVPQALEAFFESTDYESAVRGAISIGGDSDTIAAITGSVAEAYWGIPQALCGQATAYMDDRLLMALQRFEARFQA